MKRKSLLIVFIAAGLLTACGSKNTQPQEAAETDVTSSVSEDAAVSEVPASEAGETKPEEETASSDEADAPFEIEPVAESEKNYVSPEKTPAKFKDAEELTFDEWYEFDTAKTYTFEVESSSKFVFTFENGPDADLYDCNGDILKSFMFDNKVNWEDSKYIADSTYYLKAGRYYLQVTKHNDTGRYFDPRLNDPDSVCVECEDSNESFVESYNLSDDSAEDANVINLGKNYYGQLGFDDTADVFKFTLPKAAEVTIYYKSTLSHAKYGLIDSELKMVPENLDDNASELAERIGKSDLDVEILKALFSEPRSIPDGQDSVVQKIQLEAGDYYFSAMGDAWGGEALEYHSGTYEFKISVE